MVDTWWPTLATPASDPLEVLGLVAEGVTRVAGFGVAAIGLVRDDQLEIVVVAGDDGARDQLLGSRTALATIIEELEVADDWGPLLFVPHENLPTDEPWGWVPSLEPVDSPEAWHPLDALVAPLRDAAGQLLGLLSFDVPHDGLRPGPEARRILGEYAAQAASAAVLALEREQLSEQIRLATAAREIVRSAPSEAGVTRVLEASAEALVSGFGAQGLWFTMLEGEDYRTEQMLPVIAEVPGRFQAIAAEAAHVLWAEQRVEVVDPLHDQLTGTVSADDEHDVRRFLAETGGGPLMLVPVGAGADCLGHLVLIRAAGLPSWSPAERTAALDVGHDLGRVVLNARVLEREQRTVAELRALDTYKGQLIKTISHEIKNPLAAVIGHLEILESEEVSPEVGTSLLAMTRSAGRINRVVEDLLLLARVGDPAHPVEQRPVDLRAVVRDAVDLSSVAMTRKRQVLTFDEDGPAAVALGDQDELGRLVGNLLSNAVKYTDDGGHVQVGLGVTEDQVWLCVADDGIGISPEDQRQLFSEFFRSTNPEALVRPGTGLGLTIARRIVERHGGRIELDSEPGRGSRFRVWLPRARVSGVGRT